MNLLIKAIKLLFFSFFLLSSFASYSQEDSKEEKVKAEVKAVFKIWKQQQIRAGKWIANKNCNWKYIDTNNIDALNVLSFPKEVSWDFGDLNLDRKIDGLVMIHPWQCDGGNASMNFQFSLLILSKEKGYYVLEKWASANLGFGGNYYHYSSIENGSIAASYYEYKEEDARCCPSIHKRVYLEFKNDKLYFNGNWVEH
jgi:hypothetical protein